MRQHQCLSSLALFAALFAITPTARAQAAADTAPAAAVTAPKLARFVAAELPPEGAPKEAMEVVLELTIDEQGKVGEARVVGTPNAEFDELALAAVRRFEFEPARRGETPIAVKIRYAYVFEAAPPPVSEPEVPTTPNAAPPAPSAVANSAASSAASPSAKSAASSLAEGDSEFEATASVEAPPREVTRRSVDNETIARIPGTRGDPLRAIEILPGVARTSLSDGTPILRGAAWNESQAFLNGTPVPFLYHLGGLTSFLSPRLVDKVDLYPGNFSVRYGRITGSAIEVRTRDPDSPRLRAAVDLNLIDSAAYVETPLGERAGIALAARRSNIDFFFKNFVPKNTYSVVAAPIYYDYQALGYYRIDSSTRLRVMGYGSRDTLEFLFSHPPDEDPAISGKIGADTSFHRLSLELDSKPSHGVSSNVSVTVGRISQSFQFGELTQAFDGYETFGRAEVSAELHRSLRFTVGGDFFGWWLGGRYRGPSPGQAEGDPNQGAPLSTQRIISATDDSIDVLRPAAYLELAYRPIDALLILPGVRVDYYRDVRAAALDPRLAARYELSRTTTLKMGVGIFSQGPEWWQVIPTVGNPNLDPYRALQTSAGVEAKPNEHFKFGVEGFYKRLYHTVVAAEGGSASHLENAGRGRIYGAEFSSEAHWAGRGAAYLAYTLQRSERSDHGGAFRLFDKDQTHILALTGVQGLGKGWEVGARFRLVSGNPTTPIVGAVYDARAGVYVPEYGAVNSARDPMFQQLDLRVEKTFLVGPLKLGAYLDVQNVYNAKNYESKRYSFDYKKQEAVGGLPLLPNIGLRGEL